jgi:hypothetical protein
MFGTGHRLRPRPPRHPYEALGRLGQAAILRAAAGCSCGMAAARSRLR